MGGFKKGELNFDEGEMAELEADKPDSKEEEYQSEECRTTESNQSHKGEERQSQRLQFK